MSDCDGSQRPPLRESADVVRGGLVVRFRDRPPLWRRLLYYWAWRPVPRQYWGWMRDDLRSRLLGLRVNVRAILAALFAPRKARQFRARIHMRIGFDLTTCGVLAPPVGTAPAFPSVPAWPEPPAYRVPTPNARVPIRHFAWQLACWALVAGAALLGGAALPNTSFTSGPFSYAPDPNSPLTAAEVGSWSVVLVGVAALLIGAVLIIGRFRSRHISGATVHP